MKSSGNLPKYLSGIFLKRKVSFVLFFLLATIAFAQTKKIKVACIGNSVTYGLKLANPAVSAYPEQLQALLGEKYSVKNFGHSGATLLRKGHNPYAKTAAFIQALAFAPDIAIIELGLNDTDPRNWPNYQDEFIADYSWMIDTLRTSNPSVKIYICLNTPIFHDHPRFLSGTREWFWQSQAMIADIAKANQTELIDFHTPLYSQPQLFPDAVHPNEEGSFVLAKVAYQQITGDYGGLQLVKVFSSHMVMQRDKPVIFYGTANSGEKVEIHFSNSSKSSITNRNGQWKISFPPLKAGGPYSATIATGNKKIQLDDILIGEVWLCSGQSNMVFPLKSAEHSATDMQDAQSNQSIRLLQMKTLAETDNNSWDTGTLRNINKLNYFSGNWEKCDSSKAKEFSAVAYFFAQQVQKRLMVPVGIIQVAVGGSTTESWIDRYSMEHHPVLVNELKNWRNSDFFQPWVKERAGINLKIANDPKQRHPYEPSYNFEAGIVSFTRFPIRGVIWYQGESNTHNVELHEELFPALVSSWRKKWGYEFPFYYVQLSSIDRSSWPAFRFSQFNLLKKIPNSGMAVSSDLGDSVNVHPTRKKEIGERLARLALHFSYGQKDVVPYGPVPSDVRIENQKIYIKFQHAKELCTTDGTTLNGFSLIDKKGNQKKATAKIEDDAIAIFLEKGDTTVEVRYAWEPFTRANLVNEAGLPASTFKLKLPNWMP
jgi:sialate O-acetylesterase